MSSIIRHIFRGFYLFVLYGFALFGLVLTVGFLAVKYGYTNVEGNVDQNSATYNAVAEELAQNMRDLTNKTPAGPKATDAALSPETVLIRANMCLVDFLGGLYPANARAIVDAYKQSDSLPVLVNAIQAVAYRADQVTFLQQKTICNEPETIKGIDPQGIISKYANSTGSNIFPWVDQPEWQTIKRAMVKDQPVIARAAKLSGVESRQIVAACIVEQLRLYYTQRELFEKIFQPLSILSTANKMAWGVMSIKEAIAIDAESHLKDSSSPYYLGAEKANLLDFTSADPTAERYDRLTNQRDHFYSYLYGGVFLAQVEKQWERAGYSISERPEILATLYNLGFSKSKPKIDPQVGGSTINIANVDYTFGALAYEFYYSNELGGLFPHTLIVQ